MNSKNPLKISLAILMILGVGQGCRANVPATARPTLAVATATITLPPTHTKAPTMVRTSTPDEVATLHAIETATIKTLISTVQPEVLEKIPSLDGKWQAEVIRFDCMNYQYPDYVERIAYEQLALMNLSDGTEIIVEDQLQNCGGLGGGGLKGLYWSPNNRYFYYTDWREGYPDGCGSYLVPTIYRFDTFTSETIVVGGGHLAPDKTRLALWQKNEIVIWDLDQGEVGRVEGLVKVRFPGEISWSPDSQSIVYLQTEWDCAPDYGKTYLTRLNLAGMSQERLLEHEAPGFGSVKWDTIDQLILRDGSNQEWTYSLVTRELKAIQ